MFYNDQSCSCKVPNGFRFAFGLSGARRQWATWRPLVAGKLREALVGDRASLRWLRMAHDHAPADTTAALAAAETVCAAAGETFTPLRRRVLELLLERHGPAKAYDLLPGLGGGEGPAKPPTVYRALEFLMRMGLVHRIESLNAFVACEVGACSRAKIFMICERCGDAEELAAGHADHDLHSEAAARGFTIRQAIFEATGVCAQCRSAA